MIEHLTNEEQAAPFANEVAAILVENLDMSVEEFAKRFFALTEPLGTDQSLPMLMGACSVFAAFVALSGGVAHGS